MKILVTNDDGVHSSGIIALTRQLQYRHQVFMVAPRTEQSGISQAITFLRPLLPIELGGETESDSQIPGYSVDGTPTDCIKLALFKLCPFRPDLILSGINGGLNAGTNVWHSGTVAGAMAGALFGYRSMAISLEYSSPMNYQAAAEVSIPLVERLSELDWPYKTALNINLPKRALEEPVEVCVVPVETNPLGYQFDVGRDPRGRNYFWANNKPDPEPSTFDTDCSALKQGKISVSPIVYDLNSSESLDWFRSMMGVCRSQDG
jgi:5'-nucleotidase